MPPFRRISTRISIVHRIIITVGIEIQSVYRLGIKITRIIRRDKSTPFGAVVSCIEEIEPCILVVIVTPVSDRIANCTTIRVESNGTITPSVVGVSADLFSSCVVNADDVAKQIALEVVGS